MKHSFYFPFNNTVILPQEKDIAENNNFSFLPPSLPIIQNLLKTKLSTSVVLKFVLLHFHTSWKIWNGPVKSLTVNVGHEAYCRCAQTSEPVKEKKS